MEELPAYLYDDGKRYYLSINKDLYGQWSTAYVSYETGETLENLWFNSSKNLTEAAIRMRAKLKRWNGREKDYA